MVVVFVAWKCQTEKKKFGNPGRVNLNLVYAILVLNNWEVHHSFVRRHHYEYYWWMVFATKVECRTIVWQIELNHNMRAVYNVSIQIHRQNETIRWWKTTWEKIETRNAWASPMGWRLDFFWGQSTAVVRVAGSCRARDRAMVVGRGERGIQCRGP